MRFGTIPALSLSEGMEKIEGEQIEALRINDTRGQGVSQMSPIDGSGGGSFRQGPFACLMGSQKVDWRAVARPGDPCPTCLGGFRSHGVN